MSGKACHVAYSMTHFMLPTPSPCRQIDTRNIVREGKVLSRVGLSLLPVNEVMPFYSRGPMWPLPMVHWTSPPRDPRTGPGPHLYSSPPPTSDWRTVQTCSRTVSKQAVCIILECFPVLFAVRGWGGGGGVTTHGPVQPWDLRFPPRTC